MRSCHQPRRHLNSKRQQKRARQSLPTHPAGLLVAYTDGSTHRTNPGPMAWAVVYLRDGVIERTEQGALYTGTNNRAELMAVIWALERAPVEDLLVLTDSRWVFNVCAGLWVRRTNTDLWDRFFRIYELRQQRGLVTEVRHVKGHDGDPFNHLADELARQAATIAASCLDEGDVVLAG